MVEGIELIKQEYDTTKKVKFVVEKFIRDVICQSTLKFKKQSVMYGFK